MKIMIISTLAAALALSACGGSDAPTSAPTIAPAGAMGNTMGNGMAPAGAQTPTGAATGIPAGGVQTSAVPPVPVGKSMPSANGKPSPDTPDQKANDLIACEAGKSAASGKPATIPADAFEKAKARITADPQALDKCRAG